MKTKIFLIIFMISHLSSYSQSADVYFDKAVEVIKTGDFILGIKHLDTLLSIYKNNIVAYSLRGYAKGQIEAYQSAIDDFNAIIKLDPKNSTAYDHRGICKKKLKDYQGALADYNIAIKLNPENGQAFSNRAVVKYFFLVDTLGACEDWTSSKLTGYDKAFSLSKGKCPDPRASEKLTKSLSETDFLKLVKSNKLSFIIPEGYTKTEVSPTGEMPCQFAIVSKELDIEARYYIESIPDIQQKYNTEKIKVEPNDIFALGIEEFSKNVSQSEPKIYSFEISDVQNEFFADFGLYSVFAHSPDYNKNYTYCHIMVIHKHNLTDIYVSFLFNDREKFNQVVEKVFYALKFEQE